MALVTRRFFLSTRPRYKSIRLIGRDTTLFGLKKSKRWDGSVSDS